MHRHLIDFAIAFGMFVGIGPHVAGAQTPRAMTFSDALAVRSLSDARLSPNGQQVVYVVGGADLVTNAAVSDLWMVASVGGSPRRLTTSVKPDFHPEWSPDGQRIAFLSARGDAPPQVYVMSPFGGEAEVLTEAKSGVSDFSWSPDGSRIAFITVQPPSPEEEAKAKEKNDAVVVDQNFKHTRLVVIDVTTRKAAEVVSRDWEVSDPQWSPDGKQIAYTVVPTSRADDNARSDIWVVDLASGSQRKLLENAGPDRSPRWSPDGRHIAYNTREATAPYTAIPRLEILPSSGGASRRVVADGFPYQAGSATWSPDGNTLYFMAQVRATTQLFSVAAAGGSPVQLTNVVGTIAGDPSISRDGTTMAYVSSGLQRPAEVQLSAVRDARNARTLTSHNAATAALALGQGETLVWKSTDGFQVEGLLIYPVGYTPGKRYPTMVLVHGGPTGAWMQSFPSDWYEGAAHVWAGRGWAVFYPNPRGSTGYGEKFQLANIKDWGGGDYRDIQTGVDELVRRGIADPEKLAQSGWSYGGYLTAWTLTQTNRFKAVMVGAGLTNMYSMYGTNDLQTYLEGLFGGDPYQSRAQYDRASAMTYINKASTPTLILHGAVDTRVPVGQAQELYTGLKKMKVPVELVFFPREPHGLGEPRHMLDKLEREYSWFARYVLNEQPAVKTVP